MSVEATCRKHRVRLRFRSQPVRILEIRSERRRLSSWGVLLSLIIIILFRTNFGLSNSSSFCIRNRAAVDGGARNRITGFEPSGWDSADQISRTTATKPPLRFKTLHD